MNWVDAGVLLAYDDKGGCVVYVHDVARMTLRTLAPVNPARDIVTRMGPHMIHSNSVEDLLRSFANDPNLSAVAIRAANATATNDDSAPERLLDNELCHAVRLIEQGAHWYAAIQDTVTWGTLDGPEAEALAEAVRNWLDSEGR